ncbi:hypothetical protein [Dyadobacter luticola]|uniref:Outer membrane protein beta-barrel domain-containing protein n=1 Tax=Dyadobacter luticola TaxID=1979387 RepID=A0A5R9KT92_9BACT|nr:hypothetical protein [Dyadobacter luticola]TLU99433.1 hypothetical protein FEN17_23025 [Dyadobacter luticola]
MKNKLLLSLAFLLLTFGFAQAQADSTVRIFKSGMGLYAEFGLLPNNKVIREQLSRLQIKPFTSFMGSLVLARRTESEKWFSEGRLILMNSTNYTTDKDEKKAYLNGIGIGTDGGPKLVNSDRWNVTIPIGVDLMLYRLNIKSNGTATMAQVVSNPSAFQAVRLYTGNVNLHGGIGVDYKMNFMPKFNEKVYLSAKATYHQPLLGKRKWKGENVTVSDLGNLKVNQVYVQIGLVFFPKAGMKKWGGMH